jgi:integrase
MTVEQLLTDWLASKTSEGLRPATISLYRMAAESWIIPTIGALEVRNLAPARVSELVDKLRADGSRLGRGGLSSRSIQITVQVLKAATRWALETQLLNRDPLAGYRRPRSRSKVMEFWTADEARSFLAFTKDDRMAAIWALFLTRGPLRGEVAGLRWDAVDLEAGKLRITTTRVLIDGDTAESAPKTARGFRTIPLDPMLVSLLRAHRVQQLRERMAAGPEYEDGGWLVADELGRPWYPDSISERFDTLVAASGLRRIRLHDCRHSAASLMLSDRVPVHVVASILGHDPAETLRTYGHVIPNDAEAAGASLSAALLG